MRRDGSAALDLAFVARGRFEAFWEYDLKAWDVAAGALLVREAGGHVTAIDGGVYSVAGGSILYAVGYYGGYPFVHRYGKYIMFRDSELARVHGFYERYGNLTVLICRFIPFIRGISAFPAGLSRMRKRLFVVYTALGSAVYCFSLAGVGAAFGKHVNRILPMIHKFAYALVALVVIAIIAGFVAWRQRRTRAASVAKPDAL